MREILFRGKDRQTGEWVYGWLGHLHCYSPHTKEIDSIYFTEITEDFRGRLNIIVDYKTVGQYTGLKDKNGKKIFEGDILSVTVREWVKECGIRKLTGNTKKTVWSVEYAERRSQGNGFYVFGKDRRFNLWLTQSVIYNASPEIIGNIHDNPELLKGGAE